MAFDLPTSDLAVLVIIESVRTPQYMDGWMFGVNLMKSYCFKFAHFNRFFKRNHGDRISRKVEPHRLRFQRKHRDSIATLFTTGRRSFSVLAVDKKWTGRFKLQRSLRRARRQFEERGGRIRYNDVQQPILHIYREAERRREHPDADIDARKRKIATRHFEPSVCRLADTADRQTY